MYDLLFHGFGRVSARGSSALGWLVALALGLGLCAPAAATTFVRVSDEHLADGATTVVEVELLGAEPATASRFPATDVSASVLRVVQGDPTLGHVTFRVPGGVDPETGMEVRLFGTPEMHVGERALLFLTATKGDAPPRLRHLFQGFFRVTLADDGRAVAYRDFGDATEVVLSGRKSLAAEGPRDLERFVGWLGDRAAGSTRPADYRTDLSVSELPTLPLKFTLLQRTLGNPRWPDFHGGNPSNPAGTVRFFSHNGGQPGLPSGGHPEFQQAIGAWVNDPGSNIRYLYGGRTGATGGLSSFDNINTILWDDPDSIFDSPFSCTEGGTIAGASPWTSTDPVQGRHNFNGRTWATIFGADIVTNRNISCWINRLRRAQEVWAHELGHTLGVGHSCNLNDGNCGNSVLNQAIMRAQAHGDNRGAALNSDDRAAVALLYPGNVQPPAAPSNLSVQALDPGRVRLDWADNSGNESTFVVERRVGTGSFSQIGTTNANVRSFTDSTVTSGTAYGYRVSAQNSAGSSDPSNIAGVTTPGAAAPSNVTAVALSATSARLTWSDSNPSEAGFEIDADGFGAFFPAARPGAGATSATITGLNPTTEYTFRIRSVGSPAGSSSYVESNSVTLPAGTPDPCVVSGNTQCLAGDRFKVQIGWRNFEDATGTASVVELGPSSSGLFWFFDADNWEMLVKVLDGCVLTDHFWVFAAATTNLEYHLQVIDTVSGNGVVYENPLGTSSAAVTDTEALPCFGSPGSGLDSSGAADGIAAIPPERKPVVRTTDRVDPTKVDCTAGDSTLCLTQGRFRVEVDWKDFSSNEGPATVVELPVNADDSGLFWFFQSDNWEMLVKVLDGCGINGNFWVFSAATTNVEYTLTVTDTETGDVKRYTNPLGSASPAVTDIEAFATCP